MDTELPEGAFAGPRRGSFDGQAANQSTEPITSVMTTALAASYTPPVRQPSPAPSTTSSTLTDLPSSVGQDSKTLTASTSKSKKRKLTFAEREVEKALKQDEKQTKERRKFEEKRQKGEEKRKKEEEKEATRRARDLEKAQRQQAKDAAKHAKEVEKAKKEEEVKRKERSQLRIGAFFGRPAPASTPPSSPDDVSSGVSSRRSSIAEMEIDVPMIDVKPSPLRNAEYEKLFPSFFVFENTEIAPINRFLEYRQSSTFNAPGEHLDLSRLHFDTRPPSLSETFRGHQRKKRRVTGSVRGIIDRIQGTSNAPIDFIEDGAESQPAKMLNHIPIKILSFKEDVRPPYQGTYTKHVSPQAAARISRNPFHRGLPQTNYDYDSEAEWEEPKEGDDDVNLDDEDSESEADDEEMDDFLDDEDDVGRQRIVIGDMDPVCSGLCWEDDVPSAKRTELSRYRIDVLDDAHRFPIDPYSSEYWSRPAKKHPPKIEPAIAILMQPPRQPLSSVNAANSLFNQGVTSSIASVSVAAGTENTVPTDKAKGKDLDSAKPLKMISAELLPSFKEAVSGSDLTKAGLIEILKKHFPKVSKDTIKDTLSTVAVRQGLKEADKKWVLRP